MSPRLNILCTSSVKSYYVKSNNEFKRQRSICVHVALKIHNLRQLLTSVSRDGIHYVSHPVSLCP